MKGNATKTAQPGSIPVALHLLIAALCTFIGVFRIDGIGVTALDDWDVGMSQIGLPSPEINKQK